MKRRELFDDVARSCGDVGIARTRETATACREVLEHHDVAAVVGIGEPHARYPFARSRMRVPVEARALGDPHPPVLSTNRRWRSSNGGSFTKTVAGRSAPRAAHILGPGRWKARAAVDDHRLGDVALEHARTTLGAGRRPRPEGSRVCHDWAAFSAETKSAMRSVARSVVKKVGTDAVTVAVATDDLLGRRRRACVTPRACRPSRR